MPTNLLNSLITISCWWAIDVKHSEVYAHMQNKMILKNHLSKAHENKIYSLLFRNAMLQEAARSHHVIKLS